MTINVKTDLERSSDSLAAAAKTANAAVEADARSASETTLNALAANADANAKIRRQAQRKEWRQAAHNFAEGLRGVVRATPLSALFVGVAVGLSLGGRRRKRRDAARRR